MKKITKIQKLTIALFLLYIVWELYVQEWMKTEPTVPIRVDLMIIGPVLILMTILSIIQYFKK